jgi:hypothetical protein
MTHGIGDALTKQEPNPAQSRILSEIRWVWVFRAQNVLARVAWWSCVRPLKKKGKNQQQAEQPASREKLKKEFTWCAAVCSLRKKLYSQ